MLSNRNILLAISGGIAAYKCAELTRRLKERGANVRIIMTKAAQSFITPLTMQAVSGEPINDDLLDPSAEAAMGHIELAKWADLVLIAPASADVIARINAGIANDLLTTVILATDAPIAIAPAMNQQMYRAAVTQQNIANLAARGLQVWGPAQGEQACGDVGPGRMLEPMDLVERVTLHFNAQQQEKVLNDLTITITAGPTREALDPVRYISNHSSGKMGYAIAAAAIEAGATVELITGPVSIAPPQGVKLTKVTSALDMHQAAMRLAPQSDIFIACAAVADYRPVEQQQQKIKKSTDEIQLTMVKNPDIVADVAKLADKRPYTIGFAAETQNVTQYAQDKMQRKNLDMICANDVSKPEQGFNAEQNALNVFWHQGNELLPLSDKNKLAKSLLQLITKQYRANTSNNN